MTELVKSMTELVKSKTELIKSKAELINSVTDKGHSLVLFAQSKGDWGQSVLSSH